MSLYENWLKQAYNDQGRSIKSVWDVYIPQEQKIYEDILENKITNIKGTVLSLAEKYNMSNEFICGFLDGINDASENPISIKDLTETQEISLDIDLKNLYKKMVQYKAQHLCDLPQWDNIFTEEERNNLYIDQKNSRTVVKGAKIGRNEPCPCGSGKKYKRCCGAK